MGISREQLLGSLALLVFALLLRCSQPPSQETPTQRLRNVPFSQERPDTVVVELTGDTGRNGIYYVPRATPVERVLHLAGIEAGSMPKIPASCLLITEPSTINHSGIQSRAEVRPLGAQRRVSLAIPVNINVSTLEDLTCVPGIGPSTAGKILAYRDENGAFRRLDDLMNVKGIKEKRFEKLRKYLCTKC
jgi:competence protein ComEA